MTPVSSQQVARLIARANRVLWAVGWRVGPVLLRSRRVRDAVAAAGAWLAAARPNRFVEQWRENVTVATGARPGREQTKAAVRSYLRNVTEAFVLPSWAAAEVVGRVTIALDDEARLRAAVAGPGAVLALPHLGSWDHAGAWACATGMPVSTVAEQLGESEFEAFKAYRERLGMRIYSHRDPAALRGLCADVAQQRLVCLVADRTFDGRGVEASWRGVPVLAAVGPTYVARRTGAVLMGCAARYTAQGIELVFSAPVPHRPGRDGLAAMTQDLVDFYAAEVARRPTDWHVFQPFFPSRP